MKNIQRIGALIIAIFMFGLGIALMIKSSIGIGAFDALSATLSGILNAKVGNVNIAINGVFILIQIVLLGRNFKPLQFLQVPIILLFGFAINLFLYDLFKFELHNYFVRLVVFLIGNFICATAAGTVVTVNYLMTPLEGSIKLISERTNTEFVKNRFIFDIMCLVVSAILIYLYNQEMVIREGTILAAVTFSPMLAYILKYMVPLFNKWGLDGSRDVQNR